MFGNVLTAIKPKKSRKIDTKYPITLDTCQAVKNNINSKYWPLKNKIEAARPNPQALKEIGDSDLLSNTIKSISTIQCDLIVLNKMCKDAIGEFMSINPSLSEEELRPVCKYPYENVDNIQPVSDNLDFDFSKMKF